MVVHEWQDPHCRVRHSRVSQLKAALHTLQLRFSRSRWEASHFDPGRPLARPDPIRPGPSDRGVHCRRSNLRVT